MLKLHYLVLKLKAPVWNLTGFEYLVMSLVQCIVLLFVPVRGQVFKVNSAVFIFENSKNYVLAWNQISLF